MSYLSVQFDVCLLLVYAYIVLSMKSMNEVEYIMHSFVVFDVELLGSSLFDAYMLLVPQMI